MADTKPNDSPASPTDVTLTEKNPDGTELTAEQKIDLAVKKELLVKKAKYKHEGMDTHKLKNLGASRQRAKRRKEFLKFLIVLGIAGGLLLANGELKDILTALRNTVKNIPFAVLLPVSLVISVLRKAIPPLNYLFPFTTLLLMYLADNFGPAWGAFMYQCWKCQDWVMIYLIRYLYAGTVSRALDKPTPEEIKWRKHNTDPDVDWSVTLNRPVRIQKIMDTEGKDSKDARGSVGGANRSPTEKAIAERIQIAQAEAKLDKTPKPNAIARISIGMDTDIAEGIAALEEEEENSHKKPNKGVGLRQALKNDWAIIKTCKSIKEFRIKRERQYNGEDYWGWQGSVLPDKLVAGINVFDQEWRETIDNATHPLFKIFIIVCWNLSLAVEDYATIFFWSTRCLTLGAIPIWQIGVTCAVAAGYPKTKIKAAGYIALANVATNNEGSEDEANIIGTSPEDFLLDTLVGFVLVGIATIYIHGVHFKLVLQEIGKWWHRREIERKRLEMEKMEREITKLADECCGPIEKHQIGHQMI